MQKTDWKEVHEPGLFHNSWVRFLADGLVTFYIITLILATAMALFTSTRYWLWGLPVIIVSLLDIYFLTRSLLQQPKNIDVRLSTFIISVGATFGFSVWVMIISPAQFEWGKIELIRQCGKVLSLLPYPIIVWALFCLKDCFTIIPEAHTVVAHGPYQYSRHPLYVCYFVWATATFLMFPSLPMLLASSGQIAFLFLRLRREEQLLLTTFPEYRAYYQTVGIFGRK